MKDSKNVMDLKKDAIPGSKPSYTATKSKEGGFKLYHVIMMAVFGLLMGAYLQVTLFKPQPEIKV